MFSNESTPKYVNYCSTHINEPLTNYCSNVNCKVGLCATCICEHTEEHLQHNTQPIYSNIKDLQVQVNQQLETELEGTKEVLERLTKVSEKITNKEEGLKEVMKTVRKQAMEALSASLASLEQRLHSQIVSDSNKHGLHNQSRIESLTEKVRKQSESFVQGIDDIKRHDFVFELKRLTDVVIDGGRETLKEIRKEIDNNEKYMTDIQFDRQCLKENMNKAIQNIVVLSFAVPEAVKRRIEQQEATQRWQKQQQQQAAMMKQQIQGQRVGPVLNSVLNNNQNRVSVQSNASCYGQRAQNQKPSGLLENKMAQFQDQQFMTPVGNRSAQCFYRNAENARDVKENSDINFYNPIISSAASSPKYHIQSNNGPKKYNNISQ